MSRREVIAYAITHAPPGVKGGPYESDEDFGEQVTRLGAAQRWAPAERSQMEYTLHRARETRPTARVIRIVRARPSPSEASAVVLRELVAIDDALNEGRDPPCSRAALAARARRVLAAAGPDPMPVVRAAMEETDAEEAEMVHPSAANAGRRMRAREARRRAVDTYRKAGGK